MNVKIDDITVIVRLSNGHVCQVIPDDDIDSLAGTLVDDKMNLKRIEPISIVRWDHTENNATAEPDDE